MTIADSPQVPSIPYATIFEADPPGPTSRPRRLRLNTPAEPRWKTWTFHVLATAVVAMFGLTQWWLWVPAHGGVDQNGYLVGGRMVAEQGTSKIPGVNPDTHKVDPFLFVGRMWVGADLGTDAQRYYPKYPVGLSALYGLALRVGGPKYGVPLAFFMSPLCMTLSLIAVYRLGRILAGPFAGVLATVVMATCPVTFGLATNPNSHASSLCLVTWGMYLMIRWWQGNGAWRALLAGLLIGAATSIRYTEGLLFLPVLLVIIFRIRWRDRSTYVEPWLLGVGWILPVLALVCFNLKAMGTFTGYDPTNESTGFSWEYFTTNWYTMLHQIHDTGLAFVFPISIAGLFFMCAWNWRLGVVMLAWALPSLALYTFYYWAPDGTNLGYLRFFLTIFPGLVVPAYWLLARISTLAIDRDRFVRPTWISGIVAGLLTAAAMGMGREVEVPAAEADQYQRLILRDNTTQVLQALEKTNCPGDNAVILGLDENLLHNLQFSTQARLYSGRMFQEAAVNETLNIDPDAPQGLDPNRREDLRDRLNELAREKYGKSLNDLSKSQQQLMLVDERRNMVKAALTAKRRVFAVVQAPSVEAAQQMVDRIFTTKVIATWSYTFPFGEKPEGGKGFRRARQQRPAFNFGRGGGTAVPWHVLEVLLPPPAATPPPAAPRLIRRPATTTAPSTAPAAR